MTKPGRPVTKGKKIAVIGAQWGDEGKGSVVHHLSDQFDWVVRFNGGANAGHTIYRNGKKYVHNLLPTVNYENKRTKSYLASGMVLDLNKLLEEIQGSITDFPDVAPTIYVDLDAFVVTAEHKKRDELENSHIGSTKRGIGPAYSDKMNRKGTRVRDVLNKSECLTLKSLGVNFTNSIEMLKKFESANVLFEGAQGVMLDINHGTYPYVTTSDCTAAGIAACGFSGIKLHEILGVTKCYTTRVGEGPFPTEVSGAEEEMLRNIGNEWGATTGRPRRVGWLDIPALRYACLKAGITGLVVTKIDVLSSKNIGETYKVCDVYDDLEPTCPTDFSNAKAKFISRSTWKIPNTFDSPVNKLFNHITKRTGVKISYYTNGVDKSNFHVLEKWAQ